MPRALPAAVLVGLALAATPVLLDAGRSTRAAGAQTSGTGFEARATYLRDCATCHGPDGTGTSRGIAIDDKGAADIDYEVSTGRMPLRDNPDRVRRHTPAYAPAETAQLVTYV